MDIPGLLAALRSTAPASSSTSSPVISRARIASNKEDDGYHGAAIAIRSAFDAARTGRVTFLRQLSSAGVLRECLRAWARLVRRERGLTTSNNSDNFYSGSENGNTPDNSAKAERKTVDPIESTAEDLAVLILELATLIGRYSCDPEELYEMLVMFGDSTLPVRARTHFINAARMMARADRPRFTVLLDGSADGGVELPFRTNDEWPAKAYSLSMWFCIESFEHARDRRKTGFFEPRLFSMLTEKGNGLEVYFWKRRLTIRTNQTNKEVLRFDFNPRLWYHLTLVHRYSMWETFRMSSSLEVYVDGQLIGQASLRYPSVTEPIFSCTAGSSAPFDTAFLAVPEDSTLRGELGPLLLFSEAITAEQVADIWRSGFDYCPSFLDEDADTLFGRPSSPHLLAAFAPCASEMRADISKHIDSASNSPANSPKLASSSRSSLRGALKSIVKSAVTSSSQTGSRDAELKPMRRPGAIQPRSHESVFFNLANLQIDARSLHGSSFLGSKALRAHPFCRTMGSTMVVGTWTLKDSLFASQNAACLVPVLEMFMRQHAPALGGPSSGSATRTNFDAVAVVGGDVVLSMLNSLLRFISEVLWGHPDNCHSFFSEGGFIVLGLLLRRISSQLTVDTVAAVESIIEATSQSAAMAAVVAVAGTSHGSDKRGMASFLFSTLPVGFGSSNLTFRRQWSKSTSGRATAAGDAVISARAFASACDVLLWDFGVWISSSFETQLCLQQVIQHYAQRYRLLFRRYAPRRSSFCPSFGVQRLVDALSNYYWLNIPPSGTAAERYTVRRALTFQHIIVIRSEMIKTIELLVCGGDIFGSPISTTVVNSPQKSSSVEDELVEPRRSTFSSDSPQSTAAANGALAALLFGEGHPDDIDSSEDIAGISDSELTAVLAFLENCGDPDQLEDLLLFVLRQLLWVTPSVDGIPVSGNLLSSSVSRAFFPDRSAIDLHAHNIAAPKDMLQRFDMLSAPAKLSSDLLHRKARDEYVSRDSPIGGILAFWPLIFKDSTRVRNLALRIISAQLNLMLPNQRHKWLAEYACAMCGSTSAFILDAMSLGPLVEMLTARWLFVSVECQGATLDIPDSPLLALVAPSLRTASDGSVVGSGDTSYAIANPELLPAIFAAIEKTDNTLLAVQILQDVLLLSEQSEEVRELIINEDGWQDWIMSFLAAASQRSALTTLEFLETVECRLGISLLSRLLRHAFEKRDGSKLYNSTIACIDSHDVDPFTFARAVLSTLVLQLRSSPELRADRLASSDPVSLISWRNLCEFSKTVDAFIHFPNISAHRDLDRDTWLDLDLVSNFLALWDHCVGSSPRLLLFTVSGLNNLVARVVLSISFLQIHECFLSKNPSRPSFLVNEDITPVSELESYIDLMEHFCIRVRLLLVFLIGDFATWDTTQATQLQAGGELVQRKQPALTELQARIIMWTLHVLLLILKKLCKGTNVRSPPPPIICHPALLLKELLRVFSHPVENYLNASTSASEFSFHLADFPQCIARGTPAEDTLRWFIESWLDGSDLANALRFSAQFCEGEVAKVRLAVDEREKRVLVWKRQRTAAYQARSAAKHKFDKEAYAQADRRQNAEIDRRKQAEVSYDDAMRANHRAWRKLTRRFSTTRSPLGIFGTNFVGRDADSQMVFYKLDQWETSSRMRLRFKRNFEGSTRSDASVEVATMPDDDEGDSSGNDAVALLMASHLPTSHIETDDALQELQSIKITVGATLSDAQPTETTEYRSSVDDAQNDLLEFDFNGSLLDEAWCVMDAATAGAAELEVYQNIGERVQATSEGNIVLKVLCELVDALSRTPGTLVISPVSLHWVASNTDSSSAGFRSTKAAYKRWEISDIASLQRRRLQLRNNAIELFFRDRDRKSRMLNFPQPGKRKAVLSALLPLLPAPLRPSLSQTPAEILRKSGLTERWRKWEISNFEYLMALNTFAGRSFNDLTQYPVFPWVLSDYSSDSLNFEDPGIYRDLSKPIGALNPDRLEKLLERFQSLQEMDMETPPFLYGSHYSTLGQVLFVLIRVEPFSSQFIDHVQGGKFDIADRMFHSVAQAWKNCLNSPSDVKELVPECYCLPEMFKNQNRFDLGTRQDGAVLNDVVLPPWANGSAHEFVRLMRLALESDIVSARLHHWIDLIFGYKQQGKAAEQAHNVFYHLTYEGAVDLDKISNPTERAGIEAQISNFGQTPSRLLESPHVERALRPSRCDPFLSRLASERSVAQQAENEQAAFQVIASFPPGVCPSSLSFAAFELTTNDKSSGSRAADAIADLSLDAELVALDVGSAKGRCYTLHLDHHYQRRPSSLDARRVGLSTAVSIFPAPSRTFKAPLREQCGAPMLLLHSAAGNDGVVRGRVLVCVSRWDSKCLRICDPHTPKKAEKASGGRVLQVIPAHDRAITCMTSSVASPGNYGEAAQTKHTQAFAADLDTTKLLVTGSADTSLRIWEWGIIGKAASACVRVSPRPRHTLRGHRSTVVAVALCEEVDVIASAGADSTLLVHSAYSGLLLREIRQDNPSSILLYSSVGQLFAYSAEAACLSCFSVNGDSLSHSAVPCTVSMLQLSRDEQYVLMCASAQILVMAAHSLDICYILDTAAPADVCISAMAQLPDETGVLVCLTNGRLGYFPLAHSLELIGNVKQGQT